MKLLILGAGGHGKVCGEIATACGYEITFLDDNAAETGKLEDYVKLKEGYDTAFVGIGNPELREEWFEKLKTAGYKLVRLISENAIISPSILIEEESVIMAGAVVQTGEELGCGCIISAGAIVDHDSHVGEFCHVNCGAVVPSMSKVDKKIKINYGEVWKNV